MSRLDVAAGLLDRTGLGGLLLRRPPWSGVLVLSYHRIGSPDGSLYDRNAWSALPDVFDAHVRLLARHFEVVAPSQLGEARRAGRGRFVALTFDDGYRDSHDVALPVLRAHGVPAAFFPITGFVDRPRVPWWDEIAWMVRSSARSAVPAGSWLEAPLPLDEPDREGAVRALLGRYRTVPGPDAERFLDFLAEATGSGRHSGDGASELWLTWDMVRSLHAAGMDVGGHTATHAVLTTLSAQEQRAEIAGCRRRIEEEVGASMTVFAHPTGRFDAHTRASLAEEGVELAFAHSGGYARWGEAWDPYAVPRTSVSRRIDVRRIAGTLTLPRLFARW
jgi:peptidoglycan/xylan/chitin deacetylase (PgdA/CDA1 family)